MTKPKRKRGRPKKKRGRPTKFTPEIVATILDAVKAGNYIETASALAGISKDTFFAWLKKGARAPHGEYRDFSDAIKKAMAYSEALDVMRIGKAANSGNWQAAAWRLERKFHDRWGRKDKMEVTGKDGGAIKVAPEYDLNKLSIEKREKMIEFLEEAKTGEVIEDGR